MIKTAIPFLAEMATKAAPILKSFASKTIEPVKAKIVGSTIGAVGGGMIGAKHAPEGSKAKGFLIGAGVGGGVGYLGGKTISGLTTQPVKLAAIINPELIAKALKGIGKKVAPIIKGVSEAGKAHRTVQTTANVLGGGSDAMKLKGFANELAGMSTAKSNTEVISRITGHMAKNWAAPEHLMEIPKTPIAGSPEHRPWLGIKTKGAVQAIPKQEGGGLLRNLGNMARNADAMVHGGYGLTGKNIVTRTGQLLGREANEAMHYTKDGFRYKRSVPGKVLGGALASGIGFGVMQGATATNPNGTPASLPKKVFSGTSTALKWGLAAPVMAAKNVAYDIPKTLINPGS